MSTRLIRIQDNYKYLRELYADLMKDYYTVNTCGQAILSDKDLSTIDSYKDLVIGTLDRCNEARKEMDDLIEKCEEMIDELTRDSKKSVFQVPQRVHDEQQFKIEAKKTIDYILINCSDTRTKVEILHKKLNHVAETLEKYFHAGRSNSYGEIMLHSEIQKLNDFSPSHTQQAQPGFPLSDQHMRGSQINSSPLFQQQYAMGGSQINSSPLFQQQYAMGGSQINSSPLFQQQYAPYPYGNPHMPRFHALHPHGQHMPGSQENRFPAGSSSTWNFCQPGNHQQPGYQNYPQASFFGSPNWPLWNFY